MICTCHCACAEVRRHLARVSALLPPSGSQGCRSGHQVWQQAPLPPETSHCPNCVELDGTPQLFSWRFLLSARSLQIVRGPGSHVS